MDQPIKQSSFGNYDALRVAIFDLLPGADADKVDGHILSLIMAANGLPVGAAGPSFPGLFVIVDMQLDFPAARDRGLIEAIEAEADARAKAGWVVVAVRNNNRGDFSIKLPESAIPIWKEHANGAYSIHSAIRALRAYPAEIEVCGVHTSVCVLESAGNLRRMLIDDDERFDIPVRVRLDLCGDFDKYRVEFVGAPRPNAYPT